MIVKKQTKTDCRAGIDGNSMHPYPSNFNGSQETHYTYHRDKGLSVTGVEDKEGINVCPH
jgi:hypothetical protein